jgi:hypothetical protein
MEYSYGDRDSKITTEEVLEAMFSLWYDSGLFTEDNLVLNCG